MLSDLVEVEERIFESSTYGGHASQRSTLKLLALEERLGVLEKTNIVTTHCLDQVLGSRKLAKRYPEMIGIVQCVE